MNCKQGDLAIVVRGCDGPGLVNIGKSVTCLEVVAAPQIEPAFVLDPRTTWWRVDKPILVFVKLPDGTANTRMVPYIGDHCLMPIRPDPETLEAPEHRPTRLSEKA